MIHAYACHKPGGTLEPFEYDPGPLGTDQVEIEVTACGICHSDLSMLKNDWQMSSYPLVAGHEVIGTVAQTGERVTQVVRRLLITSVSLWTTISSFTVTGVSRTILR